METKGKSPEQDLSSAKDLPMELPDGRESWFLYVLITKVWDK